MKAKLLLLTVLFISFYSCNANVETYYGKEAATMFANVSNNGNIAIYKTSDGTTHWLCVNAFTATKYDYSFKETSDSHVISDAIIKITRNCNVEKEMAVITMIYEKMAQGENNIPIIDNLNEFTR